MITLIFSHSCELSSRSARSSFRFRRIELNKQLRKWVKLEYWKLLNSFVRPEGPSIRIFYNFYFTANLTRVIKIDSRQILCLKIGLDLTLIGITFKLWIYEIRTEETNKLHICYVPLDFTQRRQISKWEEFKKEIKRKIMPK